MANRNIKNSSSAGLRRLFLGEDETNEKEEETTKEKEMVETEHEDTSLEGVKSKKSLKALFNDDPEPETIIESDVDNDQDEETIPSFLRKDNNHVTVKEELESSAASSDEQEKHGIHKLEDEKTQEVIVADKTFSSCNDIADTYPLNILSSKEIEEASFIGVTADLLTTVFTTESVYKKTLPLYAYGVTKEVLSECWDHEIVCIDGKEFLSNKNTILDKENFERLIKEMELKLAIGKTFETPLCQKHIVTVDNKFYVIPVLLVNTYEFNVLKKTFSSVADVSLVSIDDVTYLRVVRL